MSEANVQVVRGAYERFAADLEFPQDVLAPDISIDAREVLPGVGVIDDVEDATAALREYAATFDDYRLDLERVIHADEDHVVTAVVDGGRIKGSSAEITNRYFHAFTFRDGVIAHWSTHLDEQRALAAAGVAT